jgi:hypothetical protein
MGGNQVDQKIKRSKKEPAMKKILIIVAKVLLVVGFILGASAWIYIPDRGNTDWQT